MVKEKQMIFVFSEGYKEYENTFLSIKEVAKFLNRSLQSVSSSMSYQKKHKKPDLILEDKSGKKHSILFEKELRNCKWYKKEK